MFRRLLRVARQRWRALFRRDAVDDELARELSFHVEQLTQEYVERGMSERDAQLAARRTIGNIPLLEEQSRDTRAVGWLHDLRQDLIYGARMLRRNPAFTVVALASLALGIGANTAILSVLDTVTRDQLHIPRDDRVVVIRTYPLDDPSQETHARVADYFAWRDENRSFDVMGAAMGNNADFGADANAPAERIGGQLISAESFAALGVQPLRGRLFTEDDEPASASTPTRVIVLSHRLWMQRFFGSADILGQQVRLDRVNRTVIGIMPETFRYPNEQTNYWIPLRMDRGQQRNPQRFFVVTARLKNGVTIEQAQSDLNATVARFARANPEMHEGWGVRVKPVREAMFGWSRGRLYTLEAAIVLVLLVACANVAGLLLARGLVRGPEIALRSALGASRGRIVRQLLTESVLLSVGGGVLGLAVAWMGIQTLVAMPPPPGGVAIGEIGLNLRMLGATAAVAIVTGLLYGIAPALVHARPSLTDTLKEPAGAGGRGRPRLRSALVAAQIAVTMVLLIGAGLLMRSFLNVASRDLRFDTTRLLTFEVRFPPGDYVQRRGSIAGLPYYEITPPPSLAFERMHRGLRAIPGTESVAGVSTQLLNSLVIPSATISLDGHGSSDSGASASFAIGVGANASHLDERRTLTAAYFLVTPDFFTAIRSSKLRGRDFTDRDTTGGEWVAIINESAARRFWPDSDPLGQTFRILNSPEERPRKVVGIVRDIPLTREGEYRPAIYTSYLQQPSMYPSTGVGSFGQMVFMMRSTGDPMSLLPAARRVISDVAPELPLANVATMDQRLRFILPQRGYVVFATTAFALTGTLLAAIGIYGVMAYSVTQRTREIGIRVALGAAAHEVVALVGRRTFSIVALGLGVGLAGALATTQLLQSQLWGVTPTDPATFALVSLAFALVSLVAAFFPMRRAMAVDPTIALRCE
jgi:putative ABC transport system permease protein